MRSQFTFSVFTATFNRAYCLHRAFEGLKAQTFRDFEWIIIDDGSVDNTVELVNQWKKEVEFPITYIWQPNQGKHIAYNTAAPLFRGELYTSVDSDDSVKPNWLERFKFHWDSFSAEDRKHIAGVMCMAEDQHGKIIGKEFPDEGVIVDFARYLLTHEIVGDKGGFVQTSIFQAYPFPADVKNVYVPEGYFIHAMSMQWKVKLTNEVLIIPYVDDRADHFTHELKKPKNFAGNRCGHLAFLKFSPRLFWVKPYTYLANAVYYSKLSFLLQYTLKKQFSDIGNIWGRVFWLGTFPLGYILAKTEKNNK